MDDQELRAAYESVLAGTDTGSRETCPSPEDLEALVFTVGGEDERLALLDHVMSCAACRRDFDLLRAMKSAEPQERRFSLRPILMAASVIVALGVGTVCPRIGDIR